jgi:hypothetical protein
VAEGGGLLNRAPPYRLIPGYPRKPRFIGTSQASAQTRVPVYIGLLQMFGDQLGTNCQTNESPAQGEPRAGLLVKH